jgi:arsenite methyltransferase
MEIAMSTTPARTLDTQELEQRVKHMYRVSTEQLPEGVTCDASLWAACIGGAMQRDRYREAIEGAGLQILEWRENPEYRFVSERADNAVRKYGVTSISLLARHPE